MIELWRDFLLALTLLTRLPVGRIGGMREGPDVLRRAVWAFPPVGALVGGIGAAVYALLRQALSAPLAALWTVAAMLALTGALHEDGLADAADALGGRDRERRLAIMRDSRIGSYGVLALILSVGIRGAAIAVLDRPARVAAALVAAGGLGRGAILLVLAAADPARPEGLAAVLRAPPRAAILAGCLLAAAAAATLPVGIALAAIALSIGVALLVARGARRALGGHTGDVLGATDQLVGGIVLTLAAALA